MATFIEYDEQEFQNATQLKAYLKLQAIVNGTQISDNDLEEQVAIIIESQIDDEFDINDDFETISFEEMEDDINHEFDDYDSEQELYF